MKKELKSKSKRKWIVGGIAAFASIALLTTGFSVWVVGTSKKSADENVTVSVDTARNDSVELAVNLGDDHTIKLEEGSNYKSQDNDFVKLEDKTESSTREEKPLTINNVMFTISFSGSIQLSNFSTISFSIENPTDDTAKKYANFDVQEDANLIKIGSDKVRKETNYKYVNLPNPIDVTNFTKSENSSTSSINRYTWTTNLDFTWGNFFGENKTPAAYYNDVYQDPDDQTIENGDLITKELNAMHDQLDGKTINLRATLNANTSTSSLN